MTGQPENRVEVTQAAREVAEQLLDTADNCCCDVCTTRATGIIARVINEAELRGAKLMQEAAADAASWAHMVPPDGGSPTEDECAVAAAAAASIRAIDAAMLAERAKAGAL